MKYVFLLGCISILLASCCNQKELGYIPIEESALAINPIVEFEKMAFKDNFGSIIQYTCLNRKKYLEKQKDCDECCDDYYTVEESDYTHLESLDNNTVLYISIVNNYYQGIKYDSPEMICGLSKSENALTASTSYSGYIKIDSMEYNARKNNFFVDSIMLRDKKFMNVYKIACKSTQSTSQVIDTIYYNYTKGFVGMKRNGVNLWVRE